MKLIAYYLPQYHTFKENDEWWGQGFTEWTNVKRAVPLYPGHNQPRVPLNQNYYDLTEKDSLKWQSDIAKKYGIYGFCYYHYWFDGRMLMQKPMEIMLENKDINLPFCICWANHEWTRAWADSSKEVLISQTYEDPKDWEKHFYYLLQFFKDDRYIRIDDKPVMVLYQPEIIPTLRPMIECWNRLARENGLKGICYMYQQCYYDMTTDPNGDLFDYEIEDQPGRVKGYKKCLPIRQQQALSLPVILRKFANTVSLKMGLKLHPWSVIRYNYDGAWKRILKMRPPHDKVIPGAFVDWDNTPRYKERGSVYFGVTPEKFEHYLTLQIENAEKNYHKDMMFIFAWNEWGEGGYLEPDEKWGYGMLEAVQNALKNSKHD